MKSTTSLPNVRDYTDGALRLAHSLRNHPSERFGAWLCRDLKMWTAAQVLVSPSPSPCQSSADVQLNCDGVGHLAWPDQCRSLNVTPSATLNQSVCLDGLIHLGPCSGTPDFLIFPGQRMPVGTHPYVDLFVAKLNGTEQGIHLEKGTGIAGFTGCQTLTVQFNQVTLHETAWQCADVLTATWLDHLNLRECAMALFASHGLANRAVRTVIAFLRKRVLYGQAAIKLPQVQHTLTEIEMLLLLSEAFAHTGLLTSSLDEQAQKLTRALCWHAREMLTEAIDQMAVLLGARCFIRNGAEGQFQHIQEMVKTTTLNFCPIDVLRDGAASLNHIREERADLCGSLWSNSTAQDGQHLPSIYPDMALALSTYCATGTVPGSGLTEKFVASMLERSQCAAGTQ